MRTRWQRDGVGVHTCSPRSEGILVEHEPISREARGYLKRHAINPTRRERVMGNMHKLPPEFAKQLRASAMWELMPYSTSLVSLGPN